MMCHRYMDVVRIRVMMTKHYWRAVRPDTALCAEKIVRGAGGGPGVEVAAAHNTKKRKMRHNSSQPPHYCIGRVIYWCYLLLVLLLVLFIIGVIIGLPRVHVVVLPDVVAK